MAKSTNDTKSPEGLAFLPRSLRVAAATLGTQGSSKGLKVTEKRLSKGQKAFAKRNATAAPIDHYRALIASPNAWMKRWEKEFRSRWTLYKGKFYPVGATHAKRGGVLEPIPKTGAAE